MSDDICPVCGVSLGEDPLPPEPGPYDWIRITASINDYPGGPSRVVHGMCLGQLSPAKLLQVRTYQKWKHEEEAKLQEKAG